jgi:hypothetical protein
MPMGPKSIGQYTCKLANNTQELIPYRLQFKYDTNRVRKYFLSEPQFEPRFLGWMMDTLAHSATPPLLTTSDVTSLLKQYFFFH